MNSPKSSLSQHFVRSTKTDTNSEYSAMSVPNIKQPSIEGVDSKQAVFYHCHTCHVYRKSIKTKKLEIFMDEDMMQKCLDKHLNKRLSHATMYCLKSELKFERAKKGLGFKSAPKSIMYKNIHKIILFESQPFYFMLLVQSKDQEYFADYYKCKHVEDVQSIYELVVKATKNNKGEIQDRMPMRYVKRLSEISLNDTCLSMTDLNQNDIYPNNNNNNNSNNHCNHHSNGHTNGNEPYVLTGVNGISKLNNGFGKSAYNYELDDDWISNTTYLQNHCVNGPVVNKDGPVYMYMSRQAYERPVN